MTDFSSTNGRRAKGALEVSMHAREMERKQALLMAEFKADAAETRQRRANRGLLANLLSALRIF